jgi:hypothetical protein
VTPPALVVRPGGQAICFLVGLTTQAALDAGVAAAAHAGTNGAAASSATASSTSSSAASSSTSAAAAATAADNVLLVGAAVRSLDLTSALRSFAARLGGGGVPDGAAAGRGPALAVTPDVDACIIGTLGVGTGAGDAPALLATAGFVQAHEGTAAASAAGRLAAGGAGSSSSAASGTFQPLRIG